MLLCLEGRITEALDRIRRGLDARSAVSGDDAGQHDAGLQADLDAERAANAELVERVRILKDRQDTQVASLTTRVDSQRNQMMKLDAELQQLRASNVQLREMNTKLREAVTKGLAPELAQEAAAAEVAALQAQRAADVAEMDAIIAELKPLIEESPHAAG